MKKNKNISLFLQKAFIDGQWVDALNQSTHTIFNPYDQSVIGTVPDMGKAETKSAINAAQNAFSVWKSYTASERSNILKTWFDLIIDNKEELATILTLEQGKPISEARGEIVYGASFIEWFAEEAKRVYGDIIPGHGRDKRIWVTKEPIGVVAAITPWNFPMAMITRKIAPALAAGCTVVVKPAEDTPYSALALAKLAELAGFPKGVINIITTSNPVEIGNELCANSLVRKLSFTGSTPVGKLLMKQCADTVKKISLELGGNAPFIVLDDANIDNAVDGAIASKFRNAGQTCVCTNRIYIQEAIYEQFAIKFSEKVKHLKIGNGMDDSTIIGPLINNKATQKVTRLVDNALQKGAKMIWQSDEGLENENFCKTMILGDVDYRMDIANEEIFGPVATLFRFKTDEEVVKMANDTPFGLASYFYGQDINRVIKLAEQLEYGMVGINTGMISTAVAPFGGIKESGIGREGSKYGIDDYLEIKYMCIGGIE